MTEEKILHSTVTSSLPDFVSLALQSAGVGTWEIDLVNQLVRWDKCCQELYGLVGHNEVTYEKLLNCVHPDDKLLVEQAREWSLDTQSGGSYDIRFRTIGADTGQLRWIRCQGRAYFQTDGKAFRVVGIAQDVTRDQPTRRELADPTRLDKLAASLSGLGIYRLSLITDELVHSTAFAYILTGNVNATLSRADFITALHPQDELVRQAALEEAVRTGILLYEPRFVWPDGTIRHTRIVGALHRDESGNPAFIVGHITEIAQSTIRQPDTETSFQTLISASPVAMGLFQGAGLVVETANEAMYRLLNGGREIIRKPLLTALPHWQDQTFALSLQQAYATGESITLPHQLVSSWEEGQLINRHYTFHCTPMLDNQRNTYAVLATALDISEQIGVKKQLATSEARFRNLIEQAPIAITLLKGRSMILEAANAKVFEIWNSDKSIVDVIGLPIADTVAYFLKQGFQELLEEVFDTGMPFSGHDVRVELERKNKPYTGYFDFVYMPMRDTSGAITGIISMATDVTERVLARRALETSEAKLRAILDNAPAAIGIYAGPDMVIEMANQTLIDIIGKGRDILGKPLHDLISGPEGQPHLQIISNVYSTGEPFEHSGLKVGVKRKSVTVYNYYNLSYSPLYDAEGQIYAVLSMGIDVTQEIKDRQKLEESERHYRQLADSLAQQISRSKK